MNRLDRRRNAEAGPGVELPITPMLDMAFQLLAFFILTYHPSSLEGQMQLTLPTAQDARGPQPGMPDPSGSADEDAEFPPEMTIKIKTREDGINDSAPSHYIVETQQGDGPPLNTLKELSDYLKRKLDELKSDRKNELAGLEAKKKVGSALTAEEKTRLAKLMNYSIKLQPNARLRYAFVVEVMDVCHAQHFTGVGFAPPPD
jgi:biopolymer transport protein ExbD